MGFKEKVLFVGVCWSCLVGIIILGIIFGGNCWQETQGNIKSQYGLGSAKAVIGNLSILIGLQDVVVSLKGFIQGEATEVHMRESFSWRDAYMKDYLKNGLQRGLPDPILTVLEYLNEDHLWGAKLCFVGRLVSAGLWISLAAGLLSAILIQIEQKWLLGNCLVVTGIAMISSCIVYDISLPSVPMVIHVSGTPLMLSKGWPYFTTLCIGVFSVLTGFIIIIVVSVDNIEAPVRLFTKLCHKTAQLFHKHVPPLRTIT